jgi:hypothetical protein
MQRLGVRNMDIVEGNYKRDGMPAELVFIVEYVPAEQNLETIGYFSARYKRRYPTDKLSSKVISLSGGRRMEVIPSAKYGFPNADDLDFYRAFLKICDERATLVPEVDEDGRLTLHPQLPSPIGFRTREIIAKAGREKSARETLAVREWVERLNATVVHGELYDAKIKKYNAKIGLEPLFRKFVHVGHRTENGETAAMNYVWLADWFIDNYFYYYLRRVDLRFHQSLSRPIAKALYPLLDNGWFAANGGVFTKRYSELCAFLDIQPYKQISRVQQQLDPSHEELVRERFLASYEYLRDKNGKWTGSIRWCPGLKWFYDQEQKKRHKDISAESAITIPQVLSLEDKNASLATQMQLPLEAPNPVANKTYGPRVAQFYAEVGYGRVSRQKIEAGVRILSDLIEKQRYTWDEINTALSWIVDNRAKFGRDIYSLNLLPHILEQALRDHIKSVAQDVKRQKVNSDREAFARQERQQDTLEQKLRELSDEQREHLRNRAIEVLSDQGVKSPFLLDSLIRSEMLYLLADNNQ